MNKEKIAIGIENQNGFRISKCDITTGKVIVNGIEITSFEDWEKVKYSIVVLQQENEKLKEENSRLKHLPKQIEQYILKEMYVNREVVAGWLQFDKLLKMIDRGMNNE